jgi:hypothetical protein
VRRRRLSLVWLIVVVIAVATFYSVTSRPPATATDPDTTTPLIEQLDALPATSGRDIPGYERDAFGSGWRDPDQNGCDARNDILARDLEAVSFEPGTHECVVTSGTLHDPYSGTTIAFLRGNDTSALVQIDHIVPLSWGWSHGAARWTDEQRVAFANDPLNLMAVDGPTNGSKSDSGPAEWMPPSAGYACDYVENFLAVLIIYDLAVDDATRVAMRRELVLCA